MAKRSIRANYRSDPPPSVIAQRPPLAPDPRSAFGDNRIGCEAWEAHIAAGRIEVKCRPTHARALRGQLSQLPSRRLAHMALRLFRTLTRGARPHGQ